MLRFRSSIQQPIGVRRVIRVDGQRFAFSSCSIRLPGLSEVIVLTAREKCTGCKPPNASPPSKQCYRQGELNRTLTDRTPVMIFEDNWRNIVGHAAQRQPAERSTASAENARTTADSANIAARRENVKETRQWLDPNQKRFVSIANQIANALQFAARVTRVGLQTHLKNRGRDPDVPAAAKRRKSATKDHDRGACFFEIEDARVKMASPRTSARLKKRADSTKNVRRTKPDLTCHMRHILDDPPTKMPTPR